MGIANGIRKQASKIAIGERRVSSWAKNMTDAEEAIIQAPVRRLEKDGLDISMAWAIIGIFVILALSAVYMMSLVLIPLTLAIVVGMILGMLAEKLTKLGVPRITNAVILSSAVALIIFLVANSLAGPLTTLANEGPDFAEKTANRLMPYLERIKWLHITPETFQSGPMSAEKLLENTGNILHLVTANLTPALVQALIFFAALLLFLMGRVSLRKSIIMVFRERSQRLAAIRVISSVEQVLGFYFATASVIYACLGVVMTIIAYAGGLPSPVLWGFFAFLSSFIPYLGITMMTLAIAIAGIITHDALVVGLIPAAAFFTVHLLMENLIFPAVMGRRLEINAFVVFLAILFWTWMWGAVGAMLALPLSLIVMTIIDELFIEEKQLPQLPK
ncbi:MULTISPECIES: AI-2E family transporter [unclassified Rhizobium]|uniref:AI-2E family transporter n=1 Tax=unclassified Rhizobium TaxID=2613769 RepID=UPI001ADA1C99|nr:MULTISPECIES: AI-2E family transporter [unclassified Rhizobium]MBO9123179.1 AI-2E family transporter [Rhizobium sp. 16-488-2b]MBO9173711.1 AI-2E family transporter [Rhizobium sp. 16-488-2a]MDM9647928.1 AI-2E family transporter [Rhizobium sp. S163]